MLHSDDLAEGQLVTILEGPQKLCRISDTGAFIEVQDKTYNGWPFRVLAVERPYVVLSSHLGGRERRVIADTRVVKLMRTSEEYFDVLSGENHEDRL